MTKDRIILRTMNLEDINGIFQLEKLWKEENVSYIYEPFTKEELVTTMTEYNDYHLVAMQENELVGYINGIIENSGKERVLKDQENYLMIENLYVKKIL